MKKLASRMVFVWMILCALLPMSARAQQTLGAINGTVTDTSNAVVPQAQVQAKNLGTGLTVSATTQNDGSYNIVDLPIGTYSVTITKQGFKTEVHSNILVRGNLATTVNATLQPGEVSTTVEVTGTPLMNQTDTTNGYTLGSEVIQNTPLGTGSFTQLAILAPGVNADLLSGSGTNAGLGNQNIFSNGQRDTSNSFAFNGVNATNVFNGKSSSSVSSNRFVLNTGESFQSGGAIQTNTSVYDAIGQGLPTPPPETIEELHVVTSMYDASQGANSGAHIQLVTKSGTNDFHGQAYEYHQTTGWDANQFFYNESGTPRPDLHRNVFGVTYGGPIIRNKMFFFGSYQGQRVSDNFAGSQNDPVPIGLTNDRSDAGLIAAANSFIDPTGGCGTGGGHPACFSGTIDPTARAMLTAKLPNGQYLVPSAQITDMGTEQSLGYATVLQGTSRLTADQINANMDYDFGSKDRLSGKYYFQRNPSSNPFTASPDTPSVLGFPMTLKAGSQVLSLDNSVIMTPNFTWEQRFGFIRQLAYGTTSQAFTPSSLGMSIPGTSRFPTINIGNADYAGSGDPLTLGPETNFANAGVFQNQFEADTDINWIHGKHSISAGFLWIRNQLNVINKNNDVAKLGFEDFTTFLQGQLCGPANFCSGVDNSELLNGSTNRYFRTNQSGAYIQDDFRIRPNLTVDAGLRWDWDGPLVEQHGFLTSFDRQAYSYDAASDTVTNIGLVVAGNNKAFGSKGISPSTLTGRQWGFGPRIGLVWSPSMIKNFVVRTGFGMYYDRGEFFTEFSPSAGGGISGPFGVTTEEPFVVPVLTGSGAAFAAPFGTSVPPPPPQNLSGVASLVPNAAQIINETTTYCTNTNQLYCGPLFFGGYDPRNTLPYSENWTLDLQWQPYNSLMLDLAYVGNHGVHETIPIPFNQALIATPQNPVLAGGAYQQDYSYGYNMPGVAAESVQSIVDGYVTGNVALRAPYLGYDPNSDFWEAEGVSHYNALQFGVHKRLSSGLMVTGSYTWSHSLDEGSGLQLFYNGNDPLNPRTAYGNSGFDRTHVFTVSYLYQIPDLLQSNGFASKIVNGWGFSGITVAESGQPYSVIDYSGGVASIYFGGGQDAITNPIVPLMPGVTPSKAELQGTLGVNPANPVLDVNSFSVLPLIIPAGTGGVPPCDPNTGACDNYETGYGTTGRNIFRGPFQTRFDFDIFKEFKITERFRLRYDAQFFNIFNHPSFDTPNNNVNFNRYYGNPPIYGNFPNTNASYLTPCDPNTGAYACPPGGRLGVITHTLGSPRFIQMALHLTF